MGLKEVASDVIIPAKPAGLWTPTELYVVGPKILKIVAHGRWKYAPTSVDYGADGDLESLVARSRCLAPEAPVGALIGKIGGSSAGTADAKPFVVGSTFMATIAADQSGLLFLTINDEFSGMENNSGELRITVSLEEPAAAPARTRTIESNAGGTP